MCWPGSSPTFTNCTFFENSAWHGGGIYCLGDASVDLTLENTIITRTISGEAAHGSEVNDVAMTCGDLYYNMHGDWIDCLEGLEGVDGNFSAQPGSCGLWAGDPNLRRTPPAQTRLDAA